MAGADSPPEDDLVLLPDLRTARVLPVHAIRRHGGVLSSGKTLATVLVLLLLLRRRRLASQWRIDTTKRRRRRGRKASHTGRVGLSSGHLLLLLL